VANSTIAQNRAQGGTAGPGGSGGFGGFGGVGGAGGVGGSGGFADGGSGAQAASGASGPAGSHGESGSKGSTGSSGSTSGSGAGGGVYVGGGTLKMFNSTVADNVANFGGGIFVKAGSVSRPISVTLESTIVARNTNSTAAGAPANDISGSGAVAGSYNLIGPGGSGGLKDGINHNQVGVTNPGLGTLAHNGGPTQTIALLPDSPAIMKGSNPLNLVTDQRGYIIPPGTTLDVGAYQTAAVSDTAPTATLQASTVTNASPLTSYTFSITFTDNGAIAASSLQGVMVQVIPPSGPAIPATVVSATPVGATDAFGNAHQFILQLRITPPGGFWTAAANGIYSVVLGGAPVMNLQGQSAPTGILGTFTVDLGTLLYHASGLSYNRALHAYKGTITLTNNGTSSLFGPFYLVLQGLDSSLVVSTTTPNVTVGSYKGSPDLVINLSQLAPGQSITIAITYGNAALGQLISYTPVIFIGALPP
jgi:hypothetical protein